MLDNEQWTVVVEALLDQGKHGLARDVLSAIPPEDAGQEAAELFFRAQRASGDAQAAAAWQRVVIYLLSLDRVMEAQAVVEMAPPGVQGREEWSVAQRAVRFRTRHLTDSESSSKAEMEFTAGDANYDLNPQQEEVLRRLDPGVRLFVDYGCNNGRLLRAVAKKFPACRCLGLDIGVARLQAAREATPPELADRIEYHLVTQNVYATHDLAWNLSTPCVVETTLCLTEVLEHVPDPRELLRELITGFRPDHLFVSVPDAGNYHRLVKKARWPDLSWAEVRGDADSFGHLWCFDALQLARMLASVGWAPDTVELIPREDPCLLFVDIKRVPQQPPRPRVDLVAELGPTPWCPQDKRLDLDVKALQVIDLAEALVDGGLDVQVYHIGPGRTDLAHRVRYLPLVTLAFRDKGVAYVRCRDGYFGLFNPLGDLLGEFWYPLDMRGVALAIQDLLPK